MTFTTFASGILLALQPALLPPPQGRATPSGQGTCEVPSNAAILFWLGDKDALAGEHIALQAVWTDSPAHFEAIPAHCLSGIAVNDAKVATLDKDGRGLLLSRKTAEGTSVTVSATLGTRAIAGRIRVAMPGANPLLGRWRESGPSRCAISGFAPSAIG